MSDATFKPYQQHQMRLLPLDLSEMIPKNHKVRVVDEIVESLDISRLKALYPGGGAPAYDPRMMLKVVIFAYSDGIYSSRKISEATHSNVYFLWLTGCTSLDHMTINRFRTERLRDVFEDIFTEVVLMLAQRGYITLETYFLDGTKLEANANKYSFTWKKSIEKNREKLRARIGALLDEIDELNDEEDDMFVDLPEPGEVTSEDVAEVARRINERLKSAPKSKTLKKAKKLVEDNYLPRMERYEQDLADMGPRKSLSKTDRDATFMRMKEDHMGNGQLKAAYNIQNGTENQYVVHTTIHQRPGDTACLKEHVESLKRAIGHVPEDFVADAGYGSEENYEYLDEQGVSAFVKYGLFHKEQKRSFKNDPTRPENWDYDECEDVYICAGGKTLGFIEQRNQKSDLGYISSVRIYACEGCSGCPYAPRCLRQGAARKKIYVNENLNHHKRKAAGLLTSDKGVELRRRRATDVETVFGDIKRNWNFKRFTLRGLDKVAHEWRLLMMGHNIRKLTRAINSMLEGGEKKIKPA